MHEILGAAGCDVPLVVFAVLRKQAGFLKEACPPAAE
jgi:hypothetical protein